MGGVAKKSWVVQLLQCYYSHASDSPVTYHYCESTKRASWAPTVPGQHGDKYEERCSARGKYRQLAHIVLKSTLTFLTCAGLSRCMSDRRLVAPLVAGGVVVQVCMLALLFRNYVLAYLVMPSQLLSRFGLTPEAERHVASFPIQTEDGEALDALEFFPQRGAGGDAGGGNTCRSPGWVVWLNANGVQYEDNVHFARALANDSGANVLLFNYRGVGRSSGAIRTAHDLVVDGKAALQHLLDQGVPAQSAAH